MAKTTKTGVLTTPTAKATTVLEDSSPVLPLPNMPQGVMAVGPQVTLRFIKEAYNQANSYNYYDVVKVDGTSYIALRNVPANTPISDTGYWVKWNDPNAQVELLQSAVEQFDRRLTAVETITSEVANSKTVMLAFGDSFGDAAGEWPDLVSSALDLELNNYCLGGDSWPFTRGLDNAISQWSSKDKSEIAFAIAYGGINKTVFGPMATAASIKTFITNFNTAFPGVPLYIIPLNNCNPYNTEHPNAWFDTVNSLPWVMGQLRTADGDFILIEGGPFFNTGAQNLWQGDLLHPNAAGSRTIANNILAAIKGNSTGYQFLQQIGNFSPNTVEAQGYITNRGIYLPRIKVTSIAPTNHYFYANGFKIKNSQPYYYYVYTNEGSLVKIVNEGKTLFDSDPINPQFILRLNKISLEADQYALIPQQFIPFI